MCVRPPRFACKGISISREIGASADVLCRVTAEGGMNCAVFYFSPMCHRTKAEGKSRHSHPVANARMPHWRPCHAESRHCVCEVIVLHRFAGKRFSFATKKHGGLAFSEAGLSTKEYYLCILAHTSKVRTPSIVSFATIIPHLITF